MKQLNSSRHFTLGRPVRRATVALVAAAALAVGFGVVAEVAQAAVTASFLSSSGVLSVFGDSLDNSITISRDASGKILVNGGAVTVSGGTPTVANTALIQVFGQSGSDTIALSELNGALPAANLFGGAGNDILVGGSGKDMLFGQGQDDTLLGKGGVDFLFGGADNDTLTAGDADDQVFGESGNDRMIWNPGDDTDLDEGGDGTDTVEVNGGNGAEQFTTTANGVRVRFDRINPAPFSLDIGTTESLVLNANGGDDTFTGSNGLAPLIALTVDGGVGADKITGGDGVDVLLGGDGDDLVSPGRGNDVAFGGVGDDTFSWNPGDGSDTLEGQTGTDRLHFAGANVGEAFDLSANGSWLRLVRNVANIVMDVHGVEQVQLFELGGADVTTINDLTGTDVTGVDADLSAAGGGDGAQDSVVVNGAGGDDVIQATGSGTGVAVVGLFAAVHIGGSEAANDTLTINALAGSDYVDAQLVSSDSIRYVATGGDGEDTLFGAAGADALTGGLGDDFLVGKRGDDTLDGGDGADTFEWNPGDGSDIVEGQTGIDRLVFDGANIGETFDLSANGSRLRLSRNVANIVMDVNGVEHVNLFELGGADVTTVNDLTGTDVTAVDTDLSAFAGAGGDGQADKVVVNGTQGADVFGAVGDAAGGVTVFGLKATVNIDSPEQTKDRLVLKGRDGADRVDAGSLAADGGQLEILGDSGADLLIGGAGDDTIRGGDGNDVAFMGAGNDTFISRPRYSSDTVEGESGLDTLQFTASDHADNIEISGNGGRVRLSQDGALAVMDLNELERIDLRTFAGADTITVDDLSGTGLTEVKADLAGAGGTADGAADRVIVNGTIGDDSMSVLGGTSAITVQGLATTVAVVNPEAASDRLDVNTLTGDDAVGVAGGAASLIQLFVDGTKI